MTRIALASLLFFTLCLPGIAAAQDGAAGASASGSTSGSSTSGGSTRSSGGSASGAAALGDEQALFEEREAPPPRRSGFEPGELHDETYIFLGALARAMVVPTFIQNLFVAGGETPVNGIGGLYFNYRKNGFNVQLEVYYQSMYVDGFYRGTNDPLTETEFVRSRLAVVLGVIGFGWAFDITDWLAFELGFGLGFGGVIGDLWRQEAYPSGGGWRACDGPADPNNPTYCESTPNWEERGGVQGRLDDTRVRGGTYQLSSVACTPTDLNGDGRIDAGECTRGAPTPGTGPNPHYFGDGGIPPIFGTVDLPRLALRIKPLHQLQIRLEAAYNLYGFSFGGSLGYGF